MASACQIGGSTNWLKAACSSQAAPSAGSSAPKSSLPRRSLWRHAASPRRSTARRQCSSAVPKPRTIHTATLAWPSSCRKYRFSTTAKPVPTAKPKDRRVHQEADAVVRNSTTIDQALRDLLEQRADAARVQVQVQAQACRASTRSHVAQPAEAAPSAITTATRRRLTSL
jgi:uncharacterized protein (DUF58 family)